MKKWLSCGGIDSVGEESTYPCSTILERIFSTKYKSGATQVEFAREDISRTARELGIRLPKNLGDLVYSFRYRAALPDTVREKATRGKAWIIRGAGPAKYAFVLVPDISLAPNPNLAETMVPDSTPGVVAKYALSDEQALLAWFATIDSSISFWGSRSTRYTITCVPAVPSIGQVETDELAKAGNDCLSVVQIEQDMAVCASKFPSLVCRAVGVQFTPHNVIALFEFEQTQGSVAVSSEKHYRLVPPDQISDEDLRVYQTRRAISL